MNGRAMTLGVFKAYVVFFKVDFTGHFTGQCMKMHFQWKYVLVRKLCMKMLEINGLMHALT